MQVSPTKDLRQPLLPLVPLLVPTSRKTATQTTSNSSPPTSKWSSIHGPTCPSRFAPTSRRWSGRPAVTRGKTDETPPTLPQDERGDGCGTLAALLPLATNRTRRRRRRRGTPGRGRPEIDPDPAGGRAESQRLSLSPEPVKLNCDSGSIEIGGRPWPDHKEAETP